MEKYREFYCFEGKYYDELRRVDCLECELDEVIHVIEHSAYADLKQAADKMHEYLIKGKKKFAPHITNSNVDEIIAEYREKFGGGG